MTRLQQHKAIQAECTTNPQVLDAARAAHAEWQGVGQSTASGGFTHSLHGALPGAACMACCCALLLPPQVPLALGVIPVHVDAQVV